MKIIPAIDIIQGQCVRLEQGAYQSKIIYNADPVDQAKQFEDHGIQYLHLVDLDGAKKGEIVNYRIIEKIASQTNLIIDFGGGIREEEDVRIALESGARQLNIGSKAVKDPEGFINWLKVYGNEKFILGCDVRDGFVAIDAWENQTQVELIPFIKSYLELGVNKVVCTDVSKDGMLEGPSIGLYKEMINQIHQIKLTASGGVSSLEDLDLLKSIGCDAAILGKAIYEKRITLKELEAYVN